VLPDWGPENATADAPDFGSSGILLINDDQHIQQVLVGGIESLEDLENVRGRDPDSHANIRTRQVAALRLLIIERDEERGVALGSAGSMPGMKRRFFTPDGRNGQDGGHSCDGSSLRILAANVLWTRQRKKLDGHPRVT
jgi:hypothetical protein